jgi:hypothetical protein
VCIPKESRKSPMTDKTEQVRGDSVEIALIKLYNCFAAKNIYEANELVM